MKNMKRVLWISVGVLILSDVLLVLTIYLIYSQCCTAPAVKNVLARMIKFKGGYVTDPMCIYGVDILGTKNVLLNLDNNRAFARIARYKRPPDYVLPNKLTLTTGPETLSYSAKPAKFYEQNRITIAGHPLYYASYLCENPEPPLGVFLGSVDSNWQAAQNSNDADTAGQRPQTSTQAKAGSYLDRSKADENTLNRSHPNRSNSNGGNSDESNSNRPHWDELNSIGSNSNRPNSNGSNSNESKLNEPNSNVSTLEQSKPPKTDSPRVSPPESDSSNTGSDEITTIEIIVTNEPSQQMLCKYYNVLLYQIEEFPD